MKSESALSQDQLADREAADQPLVRVDQLVKHFPIKSGKGLRRSTQVLKAIDGVSLELRRGETLGVVGETGCGKSTLAQTLLRLEEPTSGHAYFKGDDIYSMSTKRLKMFRRQAQIVLQDPYESLNPKMTVAAILEEPWVVHHDVVPRSERHDRAADLMKRVGLRPEYLNRHPGQFSGGQRQRISVARALALNPEVIVCDEPVSALDMSVQAQVLNVLIDVQVELGLSYIFISHDLSVVRFIADRIAVMYLGRIVETGTEDQIFNSATHPYTQALLSAIPADHPADVRQDKRIILSGDVASPIDLPSGCRFRTRCWKATELCAIEDPVLLDRNNDGHASACHYPEVRDPNEPPPHLNAPLAVRGEAPAERRPVT